MFYSILVPTDGSALSDKAAATAIELARVSGGSIVSLCVSEPYPFTPLAEGALIADSGEFEVRMRALAQQHADAVCAAATAAGVRCEAVVATSFSPSDEIVRTAAQFGSDLIVMASHGRRGFNRLLLGSETQKVLSHSSIPVLVFR
jgi:nucleotide-binding universal stress UspA family protein